MSLAIAIDSQTRGRNPEEVLELVLDTAKATKVAGLEKFTNLRTLTLNGCGLSTLEGFPQLQNLVRLELSDNNLSDGLEALQDACLVNLKSLSLAGNKFSSLESLEPLAGLPNLRDLDLFNCPVTQNEEYRSGLFELLGTLKYLDGFDAEDNEKEEDDEDDGDLDDDGEESDGESDLLGSEGLGEESDGLLDEGDESDGLLDDGEEGSEVFGEEGEEDFGEESEGGEEGEEGEEGDLGEEDDDEDDEEGDEPSGGGGDEPSGGGKRQKR